MKELPRVASILATVDTQSSGFSVLYAVTDMNAGTQYSMEISKVVEVPDVTCGVTATPS